MKETILTRWNDLSVAAKEVLQNKEPLKLPNMPQALELLSQVSQLTAQDDTHKSLIITYHVSDAIFIEMLLQTANPDLSLKLLLPHHAETNNIQNADIIIAPYSLFLFEDEHCEAFSVADFSTVIFDQKIETALIAEHLMADDAHKTLFHEENQTALLFTDFQSITDKLQSIQIVNPLESIKPKGEKISLGKAESKKKENDAAEIPTKKTARAVKKAADQSEAEETATVEIAPKKESPKAEKVTTETTAKTDPSAFIAVVARNVQRQYIRDYIREHNLQHVLIVTHNRQSARLLEKYLYRARIRSRVVHEKIDDETATSLFDRYNNGQFTALILMHRVVEDLSEKIKKCDSVIFLDFPTVYSEYANRLDFVQTNFKPQHFISIATENDKAWVLALLEEYPDLNLPLVDIDIKPPKKRANQQKTQDQELSVAVETQQNSEPTEAKAEATTKSDDQEESTKNPRDRRNNRRNTRSRNDQNQRNDRGERNERRDNNNRQRHNNRRRQEQSANHQQDQEFGDSQSDFFSANQDEIVNHNRLPFDSGSFEANIARENRRRRDPFNTPGGIGQSTNGNFLQNITQGLSPNGNHNGNPQSQNRRNNSNNNNNQRNRPRKNNRKK